MIDFVIYVEPTKVELEAMRRIAARDPYQTASMNHTWHSPLLPRPIVVNIETKRTREGQDLGMMQLGVWSAAQFTKLKQLVAKAKPEGDGTMIPFVPALFIQGHEWHFLAASPGEDGQTVGSLPSSFLSPLSPSFSPFLGSFPPLSFLGISPKF